MSLEQVNQVEPFHHIDHKTAASIRCVRVCVCVCVCVGGGGGGGGGGFEIVHLLT